MKVVCTEKKKIILFFIYSHDKFLALSLLNLLEKNPKVATDYKVEFNQPCVGFIPCQICL